MISIMIEPKDGYYHWKKGERVKLSPYFSTHEFDCQCVYDTCQDQKISKDLIDRITSVREELGSPIAITSGFRCKRHQDDLRAELNSGKSNLTVVATKQSSHERGDALDGSPRTKPMSVFRKIVEKYFDTIGLARTFLHVDTRPKRKDGSKRIWNY